MQSGTGDSISDLLQQCMEVPKLLEGEADFPFYRLIETDECSANLRAEKILAEHYMVGPEEGNIHIICSAHLGHQVAQRCWDFYREMQSGLLKTLQFLRCPGMFQKMLHTMMQRLDGDWVLVQNAPLSQEADSYRRTVLECFSPSQEEWPRANATIHCLANALLNGDWRVEGKLVHHCHPRCCTSYAHTVQKMKQFLPLLLKALSMRRLEVGNWAS